VLSRYQEGVVYTTKDGSLIRELMHPSAHGNNAQSLAEATVKIGQTTFAHAHKVSEELYYILAGEGDMRLDDDWFKVVVGDTVAILPGQIHQIKNTGNGDLVFLCCCSPAYSHDDTLMHV